MQEGKYKAILIDDESWTREVLRYMGRWEQLGIEVIAEASDGEYGLQLILSLDPDIIITDVKMPHMDGLSLLSILRKKNCRARVLFVSGYEDYQYIRNAMQLGANDYLLKPVKPEELNRQLERCVCELNQEQQRDRHREWNPQIFLHTEWLPEYMEIRGRVQEALRRNQPELLAQHMEYLEQFLGQREGDNPSKDIAIYIYYDFHNLLHRFVSDNGYLFRDFFDGTAGIYLFGNDFSMGEMLRVLTMLFQKSMEQARQLHKEKSRIQMRTVCQYIEANYQENITLEQTADKFFVSKEYFSKVFKTETGIGFVNYLTAVRMKKAKELLLTEGTAIKEIVELTGYKEIGHFYKVFKKYYGITPGEMLQGLKGL